MNTFSDLIRLSNQIREEQNDVNVEREEASITDGREKLKHYRKSISQLQIELIVHDMAFPLFIHFFNLNNGTITDFGYDLIEDFSAISKDIFYLSAYFSRHSKPQPVQKLYNDSVNPYTLFKFFKELFDSSETLLPIYKNDKKPLSKFIIQVLLHAKDLSKISDYRALHIKLRDMLHSIEGADPEILGPIIDDCLSNSSHHSLAFKSGDSITEPVRITMLQAANTTKEIVDGHVQKFIFLSDFLHLNSYIHYRMGNMNKCWFCDPGTNKDLFDETLQEQLLLSSKIGELFGGKPPIGNVYLQLMVKWEPKFVNSRLSNSAFFEITYGKITIKLEIHSNMAEIVLPQFKKKPTIGVKLLYVIQRFDGKPLAETPPEGIGLLHEFIISCVENDDCVIQPFKRKNSVVSGKCGTVLSTIEFISGDKPAGIMNGQLSSGDANIIQIIDFYTGKIVKEWFDFSKQMPPRPPQELHIGLFELALRYSIPASAVYVMLLHKLMDGWCHAESYLIAFAGLYMVADAVMRDCLSTDFIRTMWSEINERLRGLVPAELLKRLARPGSFERSGLMPLVALFGFVSGSDDAVSVFYELVDGAKRNIISGIAQVVKPSMSTRESTPEMKDLLAFLESSGATISIDEVPASSEDFSQMPQALGMTMRTEVLASSQEAIMRKLGLLREHFERVSLPAELDFSEDVCPKLAQLSVLLAKVFTTLPISISDSAIFKFILAYREVWEREKLAPELSPFKQFYNVVIAWVSSIGDRLIEWLQRAIKFDKFEVDNKSTMTSSSLGDMMTMFSQSLSFIDSLRWDDPNIVDIIQTFLSICASCLRYYTETLTMMMLNYFPREVVVQYGEGGIFNSYLEELKLSRESAESPAQIYVIINDFVSIKQSWDSFLETVEPKVGKEIEAFRNPVPAAFQISKQIPNLFAGLIAHEVQSYLGPRIWTGNSRAKLMFVKKASSEVLRPEFLQRSSAFYADLFDTTTDFLKSKTVLLTGNINPAFQNKMLDGFVRGLDAGLMSLLLVKEPIKNKRLIPLMEFVQDILALIFTELEDQKLKMAPDKYVKAAWRSRLILDFMRKPPAEVLAALEADSSGERGLAMYIIVRSFSNDKECVKYVKDNDFRFMSTSFRP